VPGRIRALFRGGSDGNERLTAATAAVLLVLLAAEGATLVAIVQLLLPHVFLGFLLIPPVALKLASTGWRMTSYYRRSDEYVRRGPPNVLLRFVVGPVAVVSTVVLFGSGVALVLVDQRGTLLLVHKASFIVWFAAMSVHVLAHVLELPQLIARDWWRSDRHGGRRIRQALLVGVLALGLGLALVTASPLADRWQDHITGIAGIDSR
jgi:hypothetical protein